MAIRLTDDNDNKTNNNNNNNNGTPTKDNNISNIGNSFSNLSDGQKSAAAAAAGVVVLMGIWKYPRIMVTALLGIIAFIVYSIADKAALANFFSFESTLNNIIIGISAIVLLFGIFKYPRITFFLGLLLGAAFLYFSGNLAL